MGAFAICMYLSSSTPFRCFSMRSAKNISNSTIKRRKANKKIAFNNLLILYANLWDTIFQFVSGQKFTTINLYISVNNVRNS